MKQVFFCFLLCFLIFNVLSFPKALSHAYASLNKSHKIKAKCIKITKHWCLSVKYNHMLIMEYRFAFFPKARCSLAPVEVSLSTNDLFLIVFFFIHESSLTSHLGIQFKNPNWYLCYLWNCTSRRPKGASPTTPKLVATLKSLTLLCIVVSLSTTMGILSLYTIYGNSLWAL